MGSETKQLHYSLENQKLQTALNFFQEKFLAKCKPPEWLMECEYTMKWLTNLQHRLLVNCHIPEKLRDYKNQGADYGFEKVCYLLTLVSMEFWAIFDESSDDSSNDEESDDKNETIEKPENEYSPEKAYTLCREALDEMASRPGDVMYTRIGAALEHVVVATRAHMLFSRGDIALSQEMAKNLQPVSEMTPENQAGIEGIKGKFILCFYEDIRKALEPSLKAIEMDPTFGAWYYQSGKIIRRLRRDFKEDMVKEELEYFEKAVELERNPKYLVYLAQALQEMSFFLSQNNLKLELVKDMKKRSAELYRECWNLQKDSTTICRRIGNGMMKFRDGNQDVELAKMALEKSVEIYGNSATIHQLGILHYKVFKDDEAALECFQKVSAIYGTANEINLRLIKDPSYDPVDAIEYWKSIAPGIVKRDILYCEIGYYYLFFKNDLTMAARYFWIILRRERNTFRMTEFRSFAFCVEGPVNMLILLVNEIVLMKDNKIQPSQSEDMNFLLDVLQKIYEKHPYLLEMKPDSDLKQSIRNKINREILSRRRYRYGKYGHTTRKTTRESEGSWRSQGSEAHDNVEGFFEKNWRRVDYQEPDNRGRGRNSSNYQNREPVSSGSRSYERGVVDGRYGSNDVNKREHGSRDCSADHRFNAGSHEGRREHNRRPFANNSRYDVTVTNWRSESRNKGNES